MPQTLDQQRAQFAWERIAQTKNSLNKDYDSYKNLAKGAPALIMGNGLMQAIAFYESKGKDHHRQLNGQLCAWLGRRFGGTILDGGEPFPQEQSADYRNILMALQKSPSALYMRAIDETLGLLKWLRQFADAVNREGR